MNREVVNFLSSHGDVKTDAKFKDITTIRMGGDIRYLVSPYDMNRLTLIIKYLKEQDIPYKIVGRGSNMICGSAPYEGCVIHLEHLNRYHFDDDGELYIEAGVMAPRIANVMASQGLSALEFASGIPGTIGGLLYMNAGAYKKSMSDIVTKVLVLMDDELVWLENKNLGFAYRTSIFQKHPEWTIVACKIKVEKGEPETIKALIADRLKRRKATQPLDKPSAGSCFRNPQNDFSWRLIDASGFRGYRYNGIEVSNKHPNFVLNVDDGTAEDFIMTTNLIKLKVMDNFGVDLIMEVELFNC